ncbi:MAG: hypothetical protein H6953_05855 [Chromatiaceae bacterium]|nr:hypothetical protein [Chromatiaceae bacterium]MCP5314909.1 hypothetical protein [Chromatiaceae bacterium]
MMREELELEKLREEVLHLKRPFWKSPPYITIAATILVALISYVSTVDEKNQKLIADLQAEREQLKEESLRWQVAATERRLLLYKDASSKADEIVFGKFTLGYVRGVLESESGKAELEKIAQQPSAQSVETFVSSLVNQTIQRATAEREEQLTKLLQRAEGH